MGPGGSISDIFSSQSKMTFDEKRKCLIRYFASLKIRIPNVSSILITSVEMWIFMKMILNCEIVFFSSLCPLCISPVMIKLSNFYSDKFFTETGKHNCNSLIFLITLCHIYCPNVLFWTFKTTKYKINIKAFSIQL